MQDPKRQARELKEKLLRDKILKMRAASNESLNSQANAL